MLFYSKTFYSLIASPIVNSTLNSHIQRFSKAYPDRKIKKSYEI